MAWQQFSISGPQTSDINRVPQLQEQPYMSSMMSGNGAYNPYMQQQNSMMGPWASTMNGVNTMNNLGSQIGSASAFANMLSSGNMQAKYPYQAMLQAEQMRGDRLNSLLNSPLLQMLLGGGGNGISGMTSNFGQSLSLGGGGGGGQQSAAAPAPTRTPGMINSRMLTGGQPKIPSATSGNSAANLAGYRPPGQKPPGRMMTDNFGSNPLIRR